MIKHKYRILLVFLGLLCIVLVGCDSGNGEETADASMGDMESDGDDGQMPGMAMAELPDDLDISTTKDTDDGLFRLTVSSELDPLVINQIHSWIVHVENGEGVPVEEAEIVLEGGMPQHDHGFPTAPEVTEDLGDGDYRIEGVKFNMGGWWEFKLAISSEGESDGVTFNVVLPQ
jgi:hypothetical protein